MAKGKEEIKETPKSKEVISVTPSLGVLLKNQINELLLVGFSFKEIRGFTDFSREIALVLDQYREDEIKFFKSYGLEVNNNGSVNWEGHKDSKEIQNRYNEILKTELVLDKGEFLNEANFEKLIEANEVSAGAVILLEDYIVKK